MEKEIQEIIEKNLPAQVGDVLKKRLDQADTLEARVKLLESEISTARKFSNDLTAENAELKEKMEFHASIDERKSEVLDRENRQGIFEAKLKATEAENRANEISGFVQMVFKSPVFRKSYMHDSMNTMTVPAHYDQAGNYVNDKETPLPPEEVTKED